MESEPAAADAATSTPGSTLRTGSTASTSAVVATTSSPTAMRTGRTADRSSTRTSSGRPTARAAETNRTSPVSAPSSAVLAAIRKAATTRKYVPVPSAPR